MKINQQKRKNSYKLCMILARKRRICYVSKLQCDVQYVWRVNDTQIKADYYDYYDFCDVLSS